MKREEEEGGEVGELELVEVEARLFVVEDGGRGRSLELTKDRMAPSSSETVMRLCLGRLRERKRRSVLVEEEGREDVELDAAVGFAAFLVLGEAAAIVDTGRLREACRALRG